MTSIKLISDVWNQAKETSREGNFLGVYMTPSEIRKMDDAISYNSKMIDHLRKQREDLEHQLYTMKQISDLLQNEREKL